MKFSHDNLEILGIETSCDDTAAATWSAQKGLIRDVVYSQIQTHKPFGGVVPELASRDHIGYLLATIKKALGDNRPDAIAYTAGPGLIGSLLVGASLAHSLCFAWDIPVIPVHHLEAHLLAVMLEEISPCYPFLTLLVSGGHTLLVQVNAFHDYKVLGESLDDAAGEAFDKTAKLLGLSYPGGPSVAKLAEKGNKKRFFFPRPMLHHPNLNFSFSGLKTYTKNIFQETLKTDNDIVQLKADIACAFEQAVCDILIKKCLKALKQTGLSRLVVAGGVAANQTLRNQLADVSHRFKRQVYFPRPKFCTDNAAMVAYLGGLYAKKGWVREAGSIQVKTRWSLELV